ncbi:hypothetical protein [Streptomyces sp. NBC_01485]|uniref:hypothetical protein n=1 Tax=Streptomyces sp. NBC_01485 TaxID=2903884 RepID=UPI003FCC84A2
MRQLIAFERVALGAGETRTLVLEARGAAPLHPGRRTSRHRARRRHRPGRTRRRRAPLRGDGDGAGDGRSAMADSHNSPGRTPSCARTA